MPSAGPFSAYMAHRRDNTARPGAAFRADAAASTLKRLVDEDGAIVYQDTASGFVISIPHRDDKGQIDRTETWPLESERITAYMTQLFMSAPENTEGYVPTLTCLNDARRALWSEATMAGRQVTTALRVAERDGFIYIDIGDDTRDVIEIGPGTWKIVPGDTRLADKGILFRRIDGQRPYPRPVRDEKKPDAMIFRQLVPHVSDDDFKLLCGWMLQTFLSDRCDRVGLSITGGQGTGKTFLTEMLQALTDPGELTSKPPEREADVAAVCADRRVFVADNLSSVKSELSDTFCRIATGATVSMRKLYTNAGTVSIRLHSSLIFNGIALQLRRSDLAERVIQIELSPFEGGQRRTRSEMQAAFDTLAPALMRVICDALSAVLRHRDEISDIDHRMGDAVKAVTAAERAGVFPWKESTFQRLLIASQKEARLDVTTDDPVMKAILAVARFDGEGTAEDIFKKMLELSTPQEQRSLPDSPRSMGMAVQRHELDLLSYGYKLERRKTMTKRLYVFVPTDGGDNDEHSQ